jgi:uncharacterized protein (TIGR00255 family)
VRLPRGFSALESQVRRFVQDRTGRGKITVNINWDPARGQLGRLRLDERRLDDYLRILDELRKRQVVSGEIEIGSLMALPDIVTEEEEEQDLDAWWAQLQGGLERAVDAMMTLKTQEGQVMANDMLARIDNIEKVLGEVETRAPLRAEEARERLRQRMNQLLNGTDVDPYRLEQEVVFQADRMDCTEECVRLRSHLKHFRESGTDETAAGRKLNFLLQEMNREANTIGSKANDSDVAHHVVAMKEELERIREQVQNVE